MDQQTSSNVGSSNLPASAFSFKRRPGVAFDLLWSLFLYLPSSLRTAIYRMLWNRGTTTSSPRVTRLPFGIYAKREVGSTLVNEALVTQHVALHTSVPVPRILDLVEHPYFIGEREMIMLMTKVDGEGLGTDGTRLDDLTPGQLTIIADTLRDWFNQLRSLVPPHPRQISGFLPGSDFYSYRIDAGMPIPSFASQDEFHDHEFSTVWEPYDDDVRELIARRRNKQYRICLTHGDITPHNILLDKNMRPTALIDWECAGWMPEYFELTCALHCRYKYQGWVDLFKRVFPGYEDEVTIDVAVLQHYVAL
ncbi:kinase-like protein [Hymenopellis radicata]|nr:kinase-like protein [Hymenopellis radicata]